VPVYVSNEDYEKDGSASADERKAYQRIYHEALKEKRSAGSVCIYLVTPEGKGLASMIVSTAIEPGRLQGFLESTIARLKIPEGKPVVPPAAQAPPPRAEAGDLVLYLVARYDHRGSWGEFPAENHIVLKPSECGKFLPPAGSGANASWEIGKETAAKLLTYFFPQTEMCDWAKATLENGPYKHRIEQLSLKGRVVSVADGLTRARLKGRLKLKHKFYPGRDDNNYVNATLVGYMDFDPGRRTIQTLRLVTDQATYAEHRFQAALRSLPDR
jgi:hypothetical protein